MDEQERLARQRELIEEFGLLMEDMGSTRMAGRVTAWLLLCDPPVQSLTEIADGLHVSKAAVSGAVRLLLQQHLVERATRAGERGDHYRATPGETASVLKLDHMRALHDILERALATVADRDQSQPNYTLMRDAVDFTEFIQGEVPELLARFERRRAAAAAGDGASPDDPMKAAPPAAPHRDTRPAGGRL